jgi:hypothetical protein
VPRYLPTAVVGSIARDACTANGNGFQAERPGGRQCLPHTHHHCLCCTKAPAASQQEVGVAQPLPQNMCCSHADVEQYGYLACPCKHSRFPRRLDCKICCLNTCADPRGCTVALHIKCCFNCTVRQSFTYPCALYRAMLGGLATGVLLTAARVAEARDFKAALAE